jgi:hypothetical protein
MNDTMIRLLRGALPLAATGMIQEVAQLTLSRMLEILPHPRQSSAPTFYMLAHSVVAVLVLMAGHMLQVTLWALLYHFNGTSSAISARRSISRWRTSPRSVQATSRCRLSIAWSARSNRRRAC